MDDKGRQISDCENANWWDVPAKAQIPVLEGECAGLWIVKEVADGALAAAQAVLEVAYFLACKGTMEAAQVALDGAQEAGDLAVKGARGTLEATQKLVDGLIAVAESALEEASKLGQEAVEGAQKLLLDKLKSCAEWVAYEAAKAALVAPKAAGSGAIMLLAEAGFKVADTVSEVAMRAWHFVLEQLTSFVGMTYVQLSAELSAAVGGLAFKASVRGLIGGDQFFGFEVDFDTLDTVAFLTNIFDKLVDLVENGILKGGNAIADDVEKALDYAHRRAGEGAPSCRPCIY